MSLLQALLHAAPSQVTLDQIRRLVALVGPEAPMVEYKANMTQSIAKAVAALANTHGGLVLIGVTDDREVTGVKERTIEAVSQHCHNTLDPPWVPEVVPVPMDNGSGKYVLMMRVVPGLAPRPLLVEGAAPIRHNNTTHAASWHQLAALFAEDDALTQMDPWVIKAPRLQDDQHSQVDLILRTGLNIGIDPRAAWRPLREQHVDQLATALNTTPVTEALAELTSPGDGLTIHRFHRRGLNRSRQVELRWQGFPRGWHESLPTPVESQLSAQMPGGYGQPGTHLLVHLDVIIRMEPWLQAEEAKWTSVNSEGLVEHRLWRISVAMLRTLMEAMIVTLLDEGVVNAFAALAQIDSLAVPQPQVLHLVSRDPLPEVLASEGVKTIPDAGTSTGTHLLADPGLDLADSKSRREQVHEWLIQTALDAGLLGMEDHLAAL